MSELTKILAEIQKETLKLMGPAVKKPVTLQNLENPDSEHENVHPNATSAPINQKRLLPKLHLQIVLTLVSHISVS